MSKKRGNGEGSIVRRKDGIWMGVITIGRNDDGSLKRKYYYGKTRQEVSEKITQALSKVNTCQFIEPSTLTVGQWLDFWLSEYAEHKIKLSTKISYDAYISKHIKPFLGRMKLANIRGDMIQKFYNDKLKHGRIDGKGGLSPKTIKNIHNMLHEALEQAIKNDLLLKNPCKMITLPKRTQKEMRVLSIEEQEQLTGIARYERLGLGIILVLFTGVRIGELLAIQWKDIDFENGILSINKTINRLKNYDPESIHKTSIVIGETKTVKSNRKVPLHDIMVEALKKHKIAQLEEKLKAGGIYEDHGFVIANELGKPIEPRTYQDFFHRLVKKAGMTKANFHSLRHTFATRALERGIPAKTVSEILGHTTVSITLDLYSHCLMVHKKESIEKLADLFLEKNPSKKNCGS